MEWAEVFDLQLPVLRADVEQPKSPEAIELPVARATRRWPTMPGCDCIPRMKAWAPWGIALLACGLATWSWFWPAPIGTDGDVPADTGVVRPQDDSRPRSGDDVDAGQARGLRATQMCLDRLQVAQSALGRCRGRSDSQADLPTDTAACLSDPDVVAVVERRIDAAIEDHMQRQRDRKAEARARERSAFDQWATQALELTPQQSEWMEQYVCTARELRDQTLASLDETPPVEALQQLKAQRKQLLEDMKELLGEDRYEELRAVGGIGLVADTTECS